MALEVGVNSYCTVADADAYFAARLNSEAWNNSTPESKETALIDACRRIDTLRFMGYKTSAAQSLQWPRVVVRPDLPPDERAWFYDNYGNIVVSDTVPHGIITAQMEEALYLIAYNGTSERADLQRQGVTEIQIGPVREKYSGAGAPTGVCEEARRYLGQYIVRVTRLIGF